MKEPRRQTSRVHRWPDLRAVVTLIGALLFMQSGAPLGVVHAQAVARTRAEVAAQTKAALAALEAAVDDIPRATFDVDAALAVAGGTAEAAFAWVRDNTAWVPYRGSLRGPVGVLLDGSGNSLDRAELLVALIEAAGGTARLARGTLEGAALEQAVAARDAAVGAGSSTAAAAAGVVAAQTATDLAAFGLDPAFVAEAVTAAEADAAALADGLAARVEQQAAFLLQAVPELDRVADPASALADHWWVQYQVGGAWVDLDPTLPDAEPGVTLVEASEFMAPGDVPAELVHTLRLEVVLECSVEGALDEHVLVTSEPLSAADLLGQRLSVQHIPVTLGEDVDPGLDQAALEELMLGQDLWFPVISFGDESLYDVQFDSDCTLSTATPPFLGSSVAGAVDAATDLFGDLFGPAPEDAVTALFIDYHLGVPGEGDVTIRRPVFDVLGQAARAAGAGEPTVEQAERLQWRLALLGETEVLATPGRLSEPFVTDLLSRGLLGKREAIVALADAGSVEEAEAALQGVADAGGPLPSALYALALARQPGPGGTAYVSGMHVVNRHNQLRVAPDGTFQRLQAFDIVANPVASLRGSAADVVSQGVRDTNAETLLSGLLCRSAPESEYCAVVGNPADALALSGPDTGAWLTLRDVEALATAELGWSPDALAGVRADLQAGRTVVVPTADLEQGTPASWWRIDTATGVTLGVNELGWGPAMAEYSMIVNFIGFAFCMAGSIGSGTSPGSVMMCTFGLATGTGAIVAGTGGIAGALMIASALLYGIGGLGYPR